MCLEPRKCKAERRGTREGGRRRRAEVASRIMGDVTGHRSDITCAGAYDVLEKGPLKGGHRCWGGGPDIFPRHTLGL